MGEGEKGIKSAFGAPRGKRQGEALRRPQIAPRARGRIKIGGMFGKRWKMP